MKKNMFKNNFFILTSFLLSCMHAEEKSYNSLSEEEKNHIAYNFSLGLLQDNNDLQMKIKKMWDFLLNATEQDVHNAFYEKLSLQKYNALIALHKKIKIYAQNNQAADVILEIGNYAAYVSEVAENKAYISQSVGDAAYLMSRFIIIIFLVSEELVLPERESIFNTLKELCEKQNN